MLLIASLPVSVRCLSGHLGSAGIVNTPWGRGAKWEDGVQCVNGQLEELFLN